MKRLLSLLGMLIVALSTFAQTFTVGDLTYSVLSSADKTAQVYNGKNATGDVVVPETVTYNDYEYKVTTIRNSAFYQNVNITSVELQYIASIGSSAFKRCTSLTSVSLPTAKTIGSSAFEDCTSLTSVSIPAVSTIENSAFSGCTSLTSVSIPAATSIDFLAFSRCASLASINIPAATSIGSSAFSSCTSLTSVSLPAVTNIGSNAFSYCSSLTSVSLPAVTSIGSSAFSGCYKICSLRIGSVEQWCNVNNLGDSALFGSSQNSIDLYIGDSETPTTDIVVPSSVTTIPFYAFLRTTITSFSAPAVTSIGYGAFFACSALTSVNLPAAKSIANSAFYNCSSLTSVELPAAESINSKAFYYCSALTSVELPAAMSIGNSAFMGCKSLSSVELPAATSIGNQAFYYCSALTSIELPVATSIGNSTFSDCGSLTSVVLPLVTSIGNNAFQYCSKINSLRIGSVEQWCNVNFGNSYANPLNKASKADLYIGNSEIPVTELTIPVAVQQIPEYLCNGTEIHTIHFEGTTPPTLANTNSFPSWTMLAVPEDAYETYLAADVYKTIPLQITIDGCTTQNIEMEADNGTSKLLEKIGEDKVRYVVNLKITGSINSYDMLIIRNQMTSLRNLDLTDASIVDCNFEYSSGKHSVKDEISSDWLNGILNLKLPATTKTIGNRAFRNCIRLLSVNIPDGVISIGDEAFYGCNKIKELILPQSVTSFGPDAFNGCSGLREIVISEGVTTIGRYAFYNCIDLCKVTIPANVKRIGFGAFNRIKPLELHISSIPDWLDVEFYNDKNVIAISPIYNAFSNIVALYVGESSEPIETIYIPEGTTELKNYAFAGFACVKNYILPSELKIIGDGAFSYCEGLSNITLPENLEGINENVFYGCNNLENITFSDNIKTIGQYAFSGCSKLTKIELPAYLNNIGRYAFQNCTNLTEVLIPASIMEVSDYAFANCNNLKTVIATTVEPIRINQNTFSTYQTATVYSPKTSYYKYYWNTQWNQFLARKEYDKEFAKTFGYKYFYLNGQNGDQKEDFEISDETGPLHGVGDDNPDADFNEGAGMIVGGEQVQELGDIHIHHNGNNGASVITKQNGKVHIDNLFVDIKTQPNRWYFFCFPFDIQPGEVSFDGSYVWYLYDGEARAMNGNGGWKKVASDGVMKAGNGYIFQGAVNGTLTIHVQDVTIDGSDAKTNMITYQSDNKNDASWNLIGNPNIAYYDIDNLGYEAPVTVYNNATGNYEAVRPGDDQYEFYPFQAFFVQKPEGVETMDFDATKKETKNKADENSKAKATVARAKAKSNSPRKVINLELASADTDEKVTDRTRIVVNPMKTTAYETDCDAAKFIADNMPQIYSRDAEGCTYAINERPVENGIIDIVVKATKDGAYTISAPRLDCSAKLRDLEAETEVDLAEGAYTFMAEAKTYTNRFQLILSNVATTITTPEDAQAAINVEAGAINIIDSNADVKVYSVGGSLVKAQKGAGTISVPAGTYVVNVNGQSVKVNVNE